jgi:hypothetical protein
MDLTTAFKIIILKQLESEIEASIVDQVSDIINLIHQVNKIRQEINFLNSQNQAQDSMQHFQPKTFRFEDFELDFDEDLNEPFDEDFNEAMKYINTGHELEEVISQMHPSEVAKLNRYNIVAEIIQSNLPDEDIFVELHQGDFDTKIFIKIDTINGPMNLLSPSEAKALDSGSMTLAAVMDLVKSLKNE